MNIIPTSKYVVSEDCGDNYDNTNPRRFGVSTLTSNTTSKDVIEHNMNEDEAKAKCAAMLAAAEN